MIGTIRFYSASRKIEAIAGHRWSLSKVLIEVNDSPAYRHRARATHFRRDGFAGIDAGASNATAKFGRSRARVNSFEYFFGADMRTAPANDGHQRAQCRCNVSYE